MGTGGDMTKQELIERLNKDKERSSGDTEAAHIDADVALLEWIDDEEIKEAFFAIERWYA